MIGYISVGSFEDWRADVGMFDEEVIGEEYEGWDG